MGDSKALRVGLVTTEYRRSGTRDYHSTLGVPLRLIVIWRDYPDTVLAVNSPSQQFPQIYYKSYPFPEPMSPLGEGLYLCAVNAWMRNVQNRISSRILVGYLIGSIACAYAFGETGWAQPEYTATITTHFSGTSQTHSGSAVLVLNHDGAATIQASVSTAGDEVLTSSGSDTLTTSYKLTGAALGGSADNDWVSSAALISPEKSYSVEGTGPSEITIWVRGGSAADRANDAGAYTGFIILTVTW